MNRIICIVRYFRYSPAPELILFLADQLTVVLVDVFQPNISSAVAMANWESLRILLAGFFAIA